MLISASIDIVLYERIPAAEIIYELHDAGWSPLHNAQTSYLPLGDKGEFNWQTDRQLETFADLEKTMHNKRKSK